MALNLLDEVRGYLTPHLLNKASEHFGEFTSNISHASAVAAPAVLSAFVRRAEEGGAQELLVQAREAAEKNRLANPDDLVLDPSVKKGWERFTGLAGNQSDELVSALTSHADIKTASAQGLLGILTQIGLGVLGRQAAENRYSPQDLAFYLSGQKAAILSATPQGLFSSGLQHQTENLRERNEGTRKWIGKTRLPYIAFGILALFAFYYIYSLNKPLVHSKTQSEPAATTTTAASPVPAPAPATRQYAKIKLVNGVVINAYHGGVEDQLIACLNSATCVAGTNQWFDFDNITFETNSATLTPASMEQVQNIVAILKAYPSAKIKIGGYTDKTGNDAANLKLSQQRADAVMNAIKNAGANSAQLVGAEGYGSQFAKAPATASDEERRKDRRIAVSLREK
jgi:outer membrane protein OmpA-like peptidoglycan-associated protein